MRAKSDAGVATFFPATVPRNPNQGKAQDVDLLGLRLVCGSARTLPFILEYPGLSHPNSR